MNMDFTNQLRAASNDETDPHKRKLLGDAATLLTVYQHVGRTICRAYNEVRSDLGQMKVPEAIAAEFGNLRDAVDAMGSVNDVMFRVSSKGWKTVHYDENQDNLPKRAKVEICPNCRRPGVVKEGKKYTTFVHSVWSRGRNKKTRPRYFCKLYHNGNIDYVGRPAEESLHRWSQFGHAVVEQPRGSYKQFRDPNDPSAAAYPLEGVTYPTDYGYLVGHTGEDGDPLDVFLGSGHGDGEYGRFFVYRPDVKGEIETKFYLGLTPDERSQVFAAFAPVLRGTPEAFTDHAVLQAALVGYRNQEGT
jgi:hypothetical protein